MPTCLGGLLPCNVSGLCISASCPSGWTWDPTTCKCLWPDRSPCPPGSETGVPTEHGNCSCPTCLRYPFHGSVGAGTATCAPEGGPYPSFYGDPPGSTFQRDLVCAFFLIPFCCPHTDEACWPVDCGTCTSGTWDPVLGYCTHAPCAAGACWCQASGTCVSCPDPACKTELNCYWDEALCAWHCDSPSCPAGQFFSLTDCACKPAGGAANLHDRWGRYHVAQGTGSGIRYRRSDFDRPPFTIDVSATGTAGDTRPSIAQDWRGRLLLLVERAGNTLEAVSTDHSRTWSGAPRTVFTGGTHPCVKVDPSNGLILRAAYHAHTIIATREYPGDLSEGAQFTFKDSAGVPLDIEDDDFDLAVLGGAGPRRYQLVARKTGMTDVTLWGSTDFGSTWTEEPA